MSKKKILISAGLVAAASISVIAAVNAFFVEEHDMSVKAVVGEVSLVNDAISISNIGNFNPGDENPETDLPDGHRPGSEHKLEYSIHNEGNKSMTTRSIIDITITGTDGNILDPSVFTLYQTVNGQTTDVKLENAEDSSIRENVILGDRLYVLNDGSVVDTKPEDVSTIQSLRYIVLGPNLNGVGEAAEIEEKAVDSKASVSYAVALDFTTPDEYQGAAIDFDVSVQCMQYRNTNSGDWKTIFKDHLSSLDS